MTTAASERFECVGGGPADGVKRDCYARSSLYVRTALSLHQYLLGGEPTAWHYNGTLTAEQAALVDPNRVVPFAALV